MTVRPILHFTARDGWINDPHGITPSEGGYDVFFQFVPASTVWQPTCRWGHATGPTLFELTELPIALAPGDGDDGIWTGSLLPASSGDRLGGRIYYTSIVQPGIGIGRVREAVPTDANWIGWQKRDIVVDGPPIGMGISAFRDPFLYRDSETVMALVGAALPNGRAAALRYEVPAEGQWIYRGVLASRSVRETEPTWMGSLWECPQMIPLSGGGHALITSVWEDDVLHYAACGLGEYRNGEFIASDWLRLTWGDSHYAPSAFQDEVGRWCVLFWMRGIGGDGDGWAGAHSVPYLVDSHDGLRLVVHPDIAGYRRPASIDGPLGPHVDVLWTHGVDGSVSLIVGATTIEVGADHGEVTIRVDERRIAKLPSDGSVRLLIDGGVVEVVVGGRICGAAIAGGAVQIQGSGSIEVWELERSWPVEEV